MATSLCVSSNDFNSSRKWERGGYKFNWRASEASATLSGKYKFELVWYMYINVYVIWAELDHSHFYMCQPFLYVPAISNVVTTGNGHYNVSKRNCALWFVFSIQSSVHGTATVN